MKAYLWFANDGNASWTVNGRQGHWQGTKPVSSKIAKCFFIILLVQSLFHNSSFTIVNTAL